MLPETSNPVHGGHLDDEGKDVVNEGVQCLVGHHPPRQMSHRLQFVVDEQLWGHHDEAKGQEEAIHGAKNKAVPALEQVYILKASLHVEISTLCSLYITE